MMHQMKIFQIIKELKTVQFINGYFSMANRIGYFCLKKELQHTNQVNLIINFPLGLIYRIEKMGHQSEFRSNFFIY